MKMFDEKVQALPIWFNAEVDFPTLYFFIVMRITPSFFEDLKIYLFIDILTI